MITKHWAAKFAIVAGLCLISSILALWAWNIYQDRASPPLSFDGNSDELQQTIVVPTLDTPIPEGKSAIWCASFQLAWNQLRSLAGSEPLKIQGAEAIADQLNNAEVSEDDLSPEIYYAAAGLARDGIAETMQREMARKFGKVRLPEFGNLIDVIAIAYAFLQAEIKFDHPFFENHDPFAFEDTHGSRISVSSFGINQYVPAPKIREQVEILYSSNPFMDEDVPLEYALDACKKSSPNQVVLAYIPKKESLKKILQDLDTKMAQYPPQNRPKSRSLQGLSRTDGFLVPNMHFRIIHQFQELEGSEKPIINTQFAGAYIGHASEIIQFKLDRSGVSLTSESKILVKMGPRDFNFNRPFLLYMKKRGAKHPFFVMWVDNAELLIKN